MPIYKSPSKSPPRDGEYYNFKSRPELTKDIWIGKFKMANKDHPKKVIHPDFLGWMVTDKRTHVEVWSDERSQVIGYQLLVPHM